jgi:hypothetical protein
MSNTLTIEVSPSVTDSSSPMVLILAHDDYANVYRRLPLPMFLNECKTGQDVIDLMVDRSDLGAIHRFLPASERISKETHVVLKGFEETIAYFTPKTNLAELIKGEHSVMINFDHFCLEFNPCETKDGGFYDIITIDDEDFEIDFTPELLEAATVDSDGTWTIGDMTLEFFELKKLK